MLNSFSTYLQYQLYVIYNIMYIHIAAYVLSSDGTTNTGTKVYFVNRLNEAIKDVRVGRTELVTILNQIHIYVDRLSLPTLKSLTTPIFVQW